MSNCQSPSVCFFSNLTLYVSPCEDLTFSNGQCSLGSGTNTLTLQITDSTCDTDRSLQNQPCQDVPGRSPIGRDDLLVMCFDGVYQIRTTTVTLGGMMDIRGLKLIPIFPMLQPVEAVGSLSVPCQ